MNNAIQIAATVGTPIALIAITAVLAFWAYRMQLKSREQRLSKIPPANRAQLEDQALTRYNLSAKDLTKEQRYNLLLQEQKDKARSFALIWVVVPGLFVVALVIAALVYVFQPVTPPPQPAMAPAEFTVFPHETCYAEGLTSLFGEADDESKPLQWMENTEFGASAQLKSSHHETKKFWVMTTDTYQTGLAECDAYLLIGTTENAVVLGYLVYTDLPVRVAPLKQGKGQGPKAEMLFRVPESHSPVRLLFMVAMADTTYAKIQGASKFRLRSRSIQSS